MLKSHHRLYFCFFLFSAITGAFYSRLPDIQSRLGVNEAELGMTLMGAAIGALISLSLCSPLVERYGVKTMAYITVIGSTACYALVAFLDFAPFAFLSLFVGGLFVGALEVNLNVELGRLEVIQKRSMMSRAHGFWSLGFFVTSLIAAGVRHVAIPADWHLGVAFVVVTLTALYMISGIVPSPVTARPPGEKGPILAMPTLALLPLCLIGIAAFLVEGAGVDWSAIYMRDTFNAEPLIGGLAITVFAFVMAVFRLYIGPLVDRWSPRLVVTILLVVCIAGLVSVWLAPHPYVALAGFALLGGGCSAIYPLVVSAAALRTDRASALNVAAISQISFVVFFLAPPLLGFVAHHFGIRESYLVCLPLMIASLFAVRSLPARAMTVATPGEPRLGSLNRPQRMAELGPLVDLRQSPTALRVQRGVMRMLRGQYDYCCYAEVPLANGRRADVLAVGPKGEIWIVEIKSSLIDFRVDAKWPDYREFCDRFYFAKPPELDPDIFPASEGLIAADGHAAAILRPAPDRPLPPPRRKAMLLKLARLGADRIHTLMDPTPGEPT